MRKLLFCLIAPLAMSCVSCEKKDHLYPVSGQVTYKGSPVSGATVFFRRPGGDTMNDHTIMGVVQEDGSFELVCGSLGSGAPPGDYDVLVEWKRVIEQGKGRPQYGPDKLKGRYNDPKRPRIRAKVKSERNYLAPFELTD